jgi:hypothetical protein
MYVELVRRIGENDRPNVSSLNHHVMPVGAVMKFLRNDLAHTRQSANARNRFVHTIITQMVGRVFVIDQNARLVVLNSAGKCRYIQCSGNEMAFLWLDAFLQEIPGDRPIKSA